MSPRTPEATEALHEDRRRAILNAALGAFVERGFDGTRMQEIAERSALSYGLVYHYVPTKEAIFASLVDLAFAAAASLIRALPQDPLPEGILAILLGSSIMKSCALSDGSFASAAATVLAASGRD